SHRSLHMPIIGWIRDLFGIQKDMYETKKTRLEIEKIEDEKQGRRITLATIQDVEKYDPKTRKLLRKIFEEQGENYHYKKFDRRSNYSRWKLKERRRRKRRIIVLALLIAALLFAAVLIRLLVK